ncbi:MAG: PAS domain-containing protein, partial [Chromatiaceae bacterium]|nr:PAS domain-containing protein [Chromatiaceae bacterium]
ARAGTYPASIAADISPERLQRFFTLDENSGHYRIHKRIRDLLVFSEQNLIRDPPFSRIDLISCRNLLIYFDASLQRKVIPLFHYALNPNGVLFLGSSENIGDALAFFTPLDRKWKIYARLDPGGLLLAKPIAEPGPQSRAGFEPNPLGNSAPRRAELDLRALTESALLQHFNAVGVLANAKGDIRYIHGRTGHYLELAAGTATMNLFQMAREGLRRPLSTALQRAVAHQSRVQMSNIKVRTNGDFTHVDLSICPVRPDTDAKPSDERAEFYLVAFESASVCATHARDAEQEDTPETATDPKRERRIAELEQELRAKEEYLQTTLEEMETSNEELKSTNEEMQSVNEELQSTNEELETSKEELQSVNEELATVNAELQTKVADLSRANDDMNNLLAGTGVATLFVDDQLRISRFTPAMTQIIKLIPGDIGRPVGDLVSNLVGYTDLIDDIASVLRTLVPKEKAVQSGDDTWFLMRIGPYRTLNNVIEGAVMTFVDITSRKRMEEELLKARTFAEAVVDAVREPLLVLDELGVIISANRAFYRYFQVSESETLRHPLCELGNRQWDNPALRHLLAQLRTSGASFNDYRIEHTFPKLGWRVMQLNARRFLPFGEQAGAILLAFEDLTQTSAQSEEMPSSSGALPPTGGQADEPAAP